MISGPQRVAIVLSKALEIGQAANVSAILTGQLAAQFPSLYSESQPKDTSGLRHAAIRFSVVLLKARPGQLKTLAAAASAVDDGVSGYCCFSSLGQSLNNAYEEYAARLGTEEVDLVGVGVYGRDETVRELTRSFSVL